MDDTYRLKIKIGPHEFEAEGPVQVVQDQFAAFKELVYSPAASVPLVIASTPPLPPIPDAANGGAPKQEIKPEQQPEIDSRLDKIMRLDDRVISLTVPADSAEQAILLLLYGQKILRKNDSVTGSEVMDGITATGGLQISRADRVLDKLGESGDVIVIGERRSRRYRLTNTGLAKARQVAGAKLELVA
jgi:hypothetical protein